MSNAVSAQNYFDTRNQKVQGRFRKDGKPKLSGYEGWKAEQRDIDGDNILDNLVVDNKRFLRYVEDYNISDRNIPLYQLQQKYYSSYPSIGDRRETKFNDYKSSLREERGLQNIQDIWKVVFDRYKAQSATKINDSSLMVQNRVKMYLYKLFQLYLFSTLGIIDRSTKLAEVETKIKDVMGSSRAKDEILKRCRTMLTNTDLRDRFERVLFRMLDKKTGFLMALVLEEYTNGTKVSKENVRQIIFGNYDEGDGDIEVEDEDS
jgi:hypothetical protein